MDIPVSKKHGVNPSLGVCGQCGKETGEILLLGRTHRQTCAKCRFEHYGTKRVQACERCGHAVLEIQTDVEAPRMVPHGLCPECAAEQEAFKLEVAKGGVYWKCACGSSGVIKAGVAMADAVRKYAGIAPPDPVGVKLDECPKCAEDEAVTANGI